MVVSHIRRIVIVNALCLSSMMLTACQTTPGPERLVTKEVRVPVAVECAVKVERPDLPDVPAAIAASPDIDALARVYRAYWLTAGAYIGELEAALGGCGSK